MHLLRRAYELDIGVKKHGRPAYTFRTTLDQCKASIREPPEGWEQLWESKEATKRHLRNFDNGNVSSGEEDIEGEELEVARHYVEG